MSDWWSSLGLTQPGVSEAFGVPPANQPVYTPGEVLTAAGAGPSWYEKAKTQAASDIAAYQRGGVRGLLADPGQTPELASGLMPMDTAFATTFTGKVFANRMAAAGRPEYAQAIAKAEDMLARGHSPQEIFEATRIAPGRPGVSFDPLNNPLIEVPDVGTTWRPEAVARTIPQTSGPGRGLVEDPTRPGYASVFEPRAVTRPGVPTTAYDVYGWHPDIAQGYGPELKAAALKWESPFGPQSGVRGGYSAEGNWGFLDPALFATPEEMRSTFLHEFGAHLPQNVEDLPAGAGKMFPVVQTAADEAVIQRRINLSAKLNEIGEKQRAFMDQEAAAGRTYSSDYEARRAFYRQNPGIKADISATIREQDKLKSGEAQQEEATKAYRNVWGEAQARNVQARRDIPAAQLGLPGQTLDVDPANALFNWNPPSKWRGGAAFPTETQPRLPGLEEIQPQEFDPRSFTDRMEAGRQAAFERTQKYGATGSYGMGTAGAREAPIPKKGTFERFGAENLQAYRDRMAQIIDEYRQRTGQQPSGVADPLLAPGERPEDLQFEELRKPTPAGVLAAAGVKQARKRIMRFAYRDVNG
jgi:hypothetical protein